MNTIFLNQFNSDKVIAGYCLDNDGRWGYNNPDALPGYEKLAAQFGADPKDFIRVKQTHSADILVADMSNAGEGVIRDRYPDSVIITATAESDTEVDGTVVLPSSYDGIITATPGIVPCVVTADCTPVFLYDPVKNVVGMVHSGRVGTMKEIAANAVKKMRSEYGTDPADIRCILGPYLCKKHHEVEEKDITGFYEHFTKIEFGSSIDSLGIKRYVDMGTAITLSLTRIGVQAENISDCNICTFENKECASYRRTRNKEQRILSFITIR